MNVYVHKDGADQPDMKNDDTDYNIKVVCLLAPNNKDVRSATVQVAFGLAGDDSFNLVCSPSESKHLGVMLHEAGIQAVKALQERGGSA